MLSAQTTDIRVNEVTKVLFKKYNSLTSLIEANTIIKLTNVDGVYDKDPNKYDDAVMYEKLTHKEVLANPEIKVMDLGAIEECMNNNIDINVINFNDKENLIRVLKNDKIGTRISSNA